MTEKKHDDNNDENAGQVHLVVRLAVSVCPHMGVLYPLKIMIHVAAGWPVDTFLLSAFDAYKHVTAEIWLIQFKRNEAVDLKYAGVEVNQRGDRNDSSEEKTGPVHIIPEPTIF